MAEAGLEPRPDSTAHPLLTGLHSIPSISMGGCPAQGIICVNKEIVLSLRQVLQGGGSS